jgi:hypothetical protein
MIEFTRGDDIIFSIKVKNYTFKENDKIILRIYNKKALDKSACICKEKIITEECESTTINLTHDETKIGKMCNKSIKLWYEVELINDLGINTIIGYKNGEPAVMIMNPEGSENDE